MPCYSTHYILIEYAMKINEEYIILPCPQVTQKFAEGAVSVPQFKQNIFHSSNAAMLDLPPGPTFLPRTLGFRLPSSKVSYVYLFLPWDFAFAVKHLLLLWGICFCREVFAFVVRYLLLPWSICFCREVFAFAVRVLVLPWQFWAIVGVSNLTKSNHLNLPKMSSIFPKYSLVGEFSWHPWISVVRAKSAVYSKELLFTSS